MSSQSQELIPIKSTTRTIQECFRTCLYVVPNFQRPYSWDKDELDDYWDDVVLAKGDFFFGSTVTWESESRELFNNSYSIIDGQQRLTTSAIILSVIRDSFAKISEELAESDPDASALARTQADNTQRYLVAVDDDSKKYPVISREEPNYKEVVLNPSAIPSGKSWNGSARQIGIAREYFEKQVEAAIKEDENAPAVEVLKRMRNNALKARVIQVELTSEEDGFLIFETLNTRGADLRLAHLVKNLLVRGASRDAEDRITVAERWDRVVESVESATASPEAMDQFLWQSWNSRRTAVTEAELYKKIVALVGDEPDRYLAYLSEIEYDATAYRYLENVEMTVNKEDLPHKSALRVPEVSDSFRALALFNVSVANSALLAIVRTYENGGLLKKSLLVEACRAIESFHFQFTALKNSGSTGGTRGRYNRFAVELSGATSRASVEASIKNLKARLASSLPTKQETLKAFEELFYAPRDKRLNAAQKRRSRKIFISYILLRLANHHGVIPAGQDWAEWTIEHIRPQKLASKGYQSPEYSIGNLAALTADANGELADGNFDEKRDGLNTFVLWKDSEISAWIGDEHLVELDPERIRKRATELGNEALGSVWAIS